MNSSTGGARSESIFASSLVLDIFALDVYPEKEI